jgi:hypothetical protein
MDSVMYGGLVAELPSSGRSEPFVKEYPWH